MYGTKKPALAGFFVYNSLMLPKKMNLWTVIRPVVIVALMCIPFSSHAYFTTGQSAESLEGGPMLFQVEYTFGTAKHDLHMPILARNTVEKAQDAVSFAILNEQGERVQGTTVALVISHATYRDNMYLIPKGVSQKMTLVVFFTPDVPSADETYRLQVTHLPFNFDGTQQLQLNDSELRYYTTKFISP